jgi:predicted RNase H-like HicB family nuclease
MARIMFSNMRNDPGLWWCRTRRRISAKASSEQYVFKQEFEFRINMRYPVAIETGTDHQAFGVVVPDLPGCFSAGDTLEEAMVNAEEAIVAWIEVALDAGLEIPKASSVQALRKKNKEWKAWVWAIVKVDPAMLDDTLERVNISLPRRVLHRLDALARATGETRSGFISRMALMGHHTGNQTGHQPDN